ncbi:MAG TPA: ABC transporter permease, partial [Vicinamibacterales bacterium]
MDTFLSDVRYTLRTWVRSPGFFLVAILTLALGIGANTTMFSLLNGTVLRSLPFPRPERLVTLWQGDVKEPDSLGIVSWPDFRDWKAMSRSFESLALFDSAGRGYNLTGDGEPEQVSGLRVTASFFDVLGVTPLYGRTFREEEEIAGRDRVVVLSHALWSRRFGADPAVVGRTIRIDGMAYEVVGVMPPGFQMQFWSGPRQLWVPAGWTAGDQQRDSNSFIAIGRLGPGVSVEAARSEMETIARSLAEAYPETNAGETVRVVPMAEYGMAGVRRTLFTALGIVGFVLLIACVNVANLMLARAATRQRELAIRSALGAGRLRILRQLLTESVLLGLAGGVAGLVITVWATAAVIPLLPDGLRTLPMRPLDAITVDLRVLAFTAAVSLLCSLLFGLAPAIAVLRGNLNAPLKEQARGSTGGRSRLRYGLVACEVALALVVLAGAGALTLSLWRLLNVPPGLDPRNVLVMNISAPQENLYYGPPGNPSLCEQLAREVGGVPGVVAASAIAHLPLGGGSAGRSFDIEGRPAPDPQDLPGAAYTVACPGILRTLGIPLLEGREFEVTDTASSPGVVIINEALARRYWPGESAVGKRIKHFSSTTPDQEWLTIVGVYGSVRHFGLDREARPSFMRPY